MKVLLSGIHLARHRRPTSGAIVGKSGLGVASMWNTAEENTTHPIQLLLCSP